MYFTPSSSVSIVEFEQVNVSWGGLLKSREVLDLLYLHYHNAHGHQTWQVCYIQWGTSLHKVWRLFDNIVFEDHVTN